MNKKSEIEKLDSAGRSVTRLWIDALRECERLKRSVREALLVLDQQDANCAAYILRNALKESNK